MSDPIDYRLRVATKRTDLPDDVIRLLSEAYDHLNKLEKRIGHASINMADWDGYYDPKSECGNAKELAMLIEDSFKILQGRSWRDSDEADANNELFRQGKI